MTKDSEGEVHGRSPRFWVLLAIATVLVGAALKAASAVVIPILFAFFIAITLAPFEVAVRRRMPKRAQWLAHLVSMLVLIVLLGAFFAGIGLAARQVAEKFPARFDDMGEVIEQTTPPQEGNTETVGADTGVAAPREAAGTLVPRTGGAMTLGQLGGWKGELGELLKEEGTDIAATVLNRMATFLTSLVLVLFLALLLLIEATSWRRKASAIFTRQEEGQWMSAVEQTARNLRRFVVAKTFLGLITAVLYAGWMAVMGLDLLLVWGVLTFLLSYVPVVGSVIAGVVAAGYAFYQLDIYGAVLTGLGLLAIEQVMGNLVEPRVLGRQLALSSFIVLASLVLWGWMWGLVGALVATPVLILILNVAARIPSLRSVAVILSENGEESVRALLDAEEDLSLRS